MWKFSNLILDKIEFDMSLSAEYISDYKLAFEKKLTKEGLYSQLLEKMGVNDLDFCDFRELFMQAYEIKKLRNMSLNKAFANLLYKKYGIKLSDSNVYNIQPKVVKIERFDIDEFHIVGEGQYEQRESCFNKNGQHRYGYIVGLTCGMIPYKFWVYDNGKEIDYGRLLIGYGLFCNSDEREKLINGEWEIPIDRLLIVVTNMYFKSGQASMTDLVAREIAWYMTSKTGIKWKKFEGIPDGIWYIEDFYWNKDGKTVRAMKIDGIEFNDLDSLKEYVYWKKNMNNYWLFEAIYGRPSDSDEVKKLLKKCYGRMPKELEIPSLKCASCGDYDDDNNIAWCDYCDEYECADCFRRRHICDDCGEEYGELVYVYSDYSICDDCYAEHCCYKCGKFVENRDDMVELNGNWYCLDCATEYQCGECGDYYDYGLNYCYYHEQNECKKCTKKLHICQSCKKWSEELNEWEECDMQVCDDCYNKIESEDDEE